MRKYEFSIHVIETTTRVRPPRLRGKDQTVINETHLREMSPAERRRLARSLAHLDYPHPLLGMSLARGRRLAALVSVLACAVLAGWIVVLVMTLHHSFNAQHWKGAWVGFDFILLFAFAVTGWAFWRGRQVVIASLIITGTLLCCDAWFDVILDAGTPDVWLSVASALFVELPLAFLMFNVARRLIRLSAVFAVSAARDPDDPGLPEDTLPPLWKIPLFGHLPSPAGNRGGNRRGRNRPAEHHTAGMVDQRPDADLVSSPWLPISLRKPRLTQSSSPSGRRRARGCARSWSRWCGTCTRSPATLS